MSWITLTRPDGKPVKINAEHVVRISLPTPFADAVGANCAIDLVNGAQAVKETYEEVAGLVELV